MLQDPARKPRSKHPGLCRTPQDLTLWLTAVFIGLRLLPNLCTPSSSLSVNLSTCRLEWGARFLPPNPDRKR
eukprot:7865632-Pyramimonas_sp.AAC.1